MLMLVSIRVRPSLTTYEQSWVGDEYSYMQARIAQLVQDLAFLYSYRTYIPLNHKSSLFKIKLPLVVGFMQQSNISLCLILPYAHAC